MERSLVDYNKGTPLIDVMLSELSGMGFVLYDIVEEHRHLAGICSRSTGFSFGPVPAFVRTRSSWS
jgi:hypothetical protein